MGKNGRDMGSIENLGSTDGGAIGEFLVVRGVSSSMEGNMKEVGSVGEV